MIQVTHLEQMVITNGASLPFYKIVFDKLSGWLWQDRRKRALSKCQTRTRPTSVFLNIYIMSWKCDNVNKIFRNYPEQRCKYIDMYSLKAGRSFF